MIREIDKIVYRQLCSWLPSKIIDCHVHVRASEAEGPTSPERLASFWAREICKENPWEHIRSKISMLFPEQEVSMLALGMVYRESNQQISNEYILKGSRDPKNLAYPMCVTRPEWSAETIENLLADGFLGLKPYSDLAPQHSLEVSIFDFLPHEHLRVLNDFSGILMLHLPRAARLADPNNIRELLEIAEKYPSIKMIVAHIGRAYCMPTAEIGLPPFADVPGVYFDTAANLNADVFEYALEVIGPDRILYGSDLPVMLMRGVREHVGDKYINFTDGPYTWNKTRKSKEIEANYTYYIYEEILALIKAMERVGLTKETAQKIFYSNCAEMISAVRSGR